MSSSTTHPLVGSYLRDLELLLHGVEAGERAEVLAGVREHLDGTLAPGADDTAVLAALDELGSPQAIADEAYAGRPATPPASPPRPGAMSRAWVPVTVGVLLGLALLVTVLVIGSLGSYATSDGLSSDGTTVVDPEVQFTSPGPGGVVIGLLASWFFWVPATILTLASPLWTNRQKVTLCLLTPLALVALVALPTIGWQSSHTELGINLGAWTSLALVLLGGGVLVWRLCRAAARKTAP
ncbi:hypothetical protein SAMN04489867_2079 [Pedococcus dokdonensis]|uniref:DUF1700 domain-containing protein n=1 Tax=Pedococcus dokdonensis TaxID=443156 RepID=A0A1H0RT12_9MICO|nr:hypothetical protein [Pedococcus dokdonensis]SDP32550.1 hypothetical protein SAMN04489867_2079 [Pedococcus dokdonensis]